jgi:OOP family OmpA-OmpF porin
VPPAPVIHRVSLETELLFEFDSSRLRPQGEEKLRELTKTIKGAQLERLIAIGHADRIGTKDYNLDLSQQRAESVRNYLGELGIETKRVETAGKCKGLRGAKLITCLQPNRRVEVEVRGHRVASR